MKLLIISCLSALSLSFQSPNVTVVKKNGDAIKLSNVSYVQSSSATGSSDLVFTHNGKKMELSSIQVKRINLKEVAEKKKGVITWEALLVKPNGDKLEIRLDLDGVSGMNEKGSVVGISGNAIDKISF